MSYSEVGIVNLALSRIGVEKITAAEWTTPTTVQQAIDAYAVWEYIRDEVLSAVDWRFAKVRTTLDRSIATPVYGYNYYYVLPRDFLRLPIGTRVDPSVYPVGVSNTEFPLGVDREVATRLSKYSWRFETIAVETGLEKLTNGAFTGASTGWTLGTGWAYSSNNIVRTAQSSITTLSQLVGSMVSVPVVGEMYALEFDLDAIGDGALVPSVGGITGDPVSTTGVKYQILDPCTSAAGDLVFTPSSKDLTCTIDDISLIKVEERLCILTDYEDSEDGPLYLTYIRKVTDPTKYPASFINALAWRLAAELATTRTESPNKFGWCMEMYQKALSAAVGYNQHMDYLKDELGSNAWERAGR